jgi:hypothetical protein
MPATQRVAGQNRPKEWHGNPAALLLQQKGGTAPTPQGSRVAYRVAAKAAGEIDLAAVCWPPALFNDLLRQAWRNSVPVLSHHGRVAGGPSLLDFLHDPAVSGRFQRVSLARVHDQQNMVSVHLAVAADQVRDCVQGLTGGLAPLEAQPAKVRTGKPRLVRGNSAPPAAMTNRNLMLIDAVDKTPAPGRLSTQDRTRLPNLRQMKVLRPDTFSGRHHPPREAD